MNNKQKPGSMPGCRVFIVLLCFDETRNWKGSKAMGEKSHVFLKRRR